MKKSSNHRSPEEKQAILAEAKERGVSATAKAHGIPASNIYNWQARLAAKNGKSKGTQAKSKGKRLAPVAAPRASLLATYSLIALVRDGVLSATVAARVIDELER
jgi:transposase-like protein